MSRFVSLLVAIIGLSGSSALAAQPSSSCNRIVVGASAAYVQASKPGSPITAGDKRRNERQVRAMAPSEWSKQVMRDCPGANTSWRRATQKSISCGYTVETRYQCDVKAMPAHK